VFLFFFLYYRFLEILIETAVGTMDLWTTDRFPFRI